jgi:hypothetical protein
MTDIAASISNPMQSFANQLVATKEMHQYDSSSLLTLGSNIYPLLHFTTLAFF